jgi:hypothetical protein
MADRTGGVMTANTKEKTTIIRGERVPGDSGLPYAVRKIGDPAHEVRVASRAAAEREKRRQEAEEGATDLEIVEY